LAALEDVEDDRVPKGVFVKEIRDPVNLDNNKTLKYKVPNMEEYDIADYLTFDELALIAEDIDDVDYGNMSPETKLRYDKYVEALYKKMDDIPTVEPPPPAAPQLVEPSLAAPQVAAV
jgi:xanthine dehydrogenase iron-sulfur cluster and FAD-binding subunit A